MLLAAVSGSTTFTAAFSVLYEIVRPVLTFFVVLGSSEMAPYVGASFTAATSN